MLKPLFSIIVPVYNVEEYINETINSILQQTYNNWECILVDDGSNDQSSAICDEFAKKDCRIRVIHKDNGGLVSARNAGFNVMTGDWHMYLDGDDWIDTTTFEELAKYIERYPDSDVMFWKVVQDLNGTPIKGKWEWPCTEAEHTYEGIDCHELARHTMIYKSGITTAYAKLINTKWAREFNIRHDDRLRQGEEGVEYSLRLFYNARKALFINAYWNHYRYTEGSITKQINEKNTEYITDCFKVMEEDIETFENKDAVRTMLYQRVVYGLIAIAMSTYFHPNNNDSIWVKVKKFRNVIKNTPLYKESIRETPLDYMDKLRIITLYCMKFRLYVMLHFIGVAKQLMLKRGKFNY